MVPAVRHKVDYESARFYIPKLLFPRAEIRFEKKGTHLMAMIVGLIAFFAFTMLVLYFLPDIVKLAKDIL